MKLNVGKRILMFFHWLFSLLIAAAFVAWLIRPEFVKDVYGTLTSGLRDTQIMAIGIAILAIYTILTVVQACLIFQRGKRWERGFITVDSSDTGRVRIAVPAIEQMVRQSVHSIDGIADMKIGIENLDDAIIIHIAASIFNGSHVPTITMNMQRAIRQFVEMNCGVAVRSVSISINGVANSAEASRRRRGRRGEDAVGEAVAAPPVMAQPEADTREAAGSQEPQERPISLKLERTPAFDCDSADAATGAADDATAGAGVADGDVVATDQAMGCDAADPADDTATAFDGDRAPDFAEDDAEMPDPDLRID